MADAIMKWADYQEERPGTPGSYHVGIDSGIRPGVWWAFIAFYRATYPETPPRDGVTTYLDYHRFYWWLERVEALPELPDPLPEIVPFVNGGRWVVQCPSCRMGRPVEFGSPTICLECGDGGWQRVVPPAGWEAVEDELLELPGNRLNAPQRNWRPS